MEENEKAFLTPQIIDPGAEKHFRVLVKKEFSAKKPFGADMGSVFAAGKQVSGVGETGGVLGNLSKGPSG